MKDIKIISHTAVNDVTFI